MTGNADTNITSWAEGALDLVDEPVEDHAPEEMLVSLLHAHVKPDCSGSEIANLIAGERERKD